MMSRNCFFTASWLSTDNTSLIEILSATTTWTDCFFRLQICSVIWSWVDKSIKETTSFILFEDVVCFCWLAFGSVNFLRICPLLVESNSVLFVLYINRNWKLAYEGMHIVIRSDVNFHWIVVCHTMYFKIFPLLWYLLSNCPLLTKYYSALYVIFLLIQLRLYTISEWYRQSVENPTW